MRYRIRRVGALYRVWMAMCVCWYMPALVDAVTIVLTVDHSLITLLYQHLLEYQQTISHMVWHKLLNWSNEEWGPVIEAAIFGEGANSETGNSGTTNIEYIKSWYSLPSECKNSTRTSCYWTAHHIDNFAMCDIIKLQLHQCKMQTTKQQLQLHVGSTNIGYEQYIVSINAARVGDNRHDVIINTKWV